MQLAEDGYYGKFQPLAEQMRKLSAEGVAYPMSLPQWVDTTTPQLFTLLEIMYGAGEASEAYTASLQSSDAGCSSTSGSCCSASASAPRRSGWRCAAIAGP